MKNKFLKEAQTLKVKRPFGRTLGLTLIFLIFLPAFFEVAARLEFIQALLPAPSIASGHNGLDLKLFLLDNLIKKTGKIDCIFLGGSDMNAAVNPELFSQVFEKHTGQKLICFNFGLAGFIPPAAALMAKILVKKYHPPLLVWGFSPASFGDEFKRKPASIINHTPWCRYWLGDFTLDGWLAEISYAYRYFLRFRIWLERPDYAEVLLGREERLSEYGYLKAERVKTFIRFKRDIEKENRFRDMLSKFDVAIEATAALEQVLRLHSQTKIVLVDIPVHPQVLTLHDRGADIHRKTASYIKKRAGQKKVSFFFNNRPGFIPEKGFKDLNHMNTIGAKIFSRWLGRQVANAVRKELITIPDYTRPVSTSIEE